MDKDRQKQDQSYQHLKQQIWNQPRALKFLEQLERHEAATPMLLKVGRQFVAGQHGEADILTTIYTELLRNSNPKTILKRVAELHAITVNILRDLSWIAGEVDQLKMWKAHRQVGFKDWAEFSEGVLGLSGTVVEALQLAREQITNRNLNHFLQAMIKGYVAPASSQEKPLPAGEQGLPRPSDPQTLITALKARLEKAEFDNGKLVRTNHELEERLVQTRADKYREVQKREALINKLCRNLEPSMVATLKGQEKKPRVSATPHATWRGVAGQPCSVK